MYCDEIRDILRASVIEREASRIITKPSSDVINFIHAKLHSRREKIDTSTETQQRLSLAKLQLGRREDYAPGHCLKHDSSWIVSGWISKAMPPVPTFTNQLKTQGWELLQNEGVIAENRECRTCGHRLKYLDIEHLRCHADVICGESSAPIHTAAGSGSAMLRLSDCGELRLKNLIAKRRANAVEKIDEIQTEQEIDEGALSEEEAGRDEADDCGGGRGGPTKKRRLVEGADGIWSTTYAPTVVIFKTLTEWPTSRIQLKFQGDGAGAIASRLRVFRRDLKGGKFKASAYLTNIVKEDDRATLLGAVHVRAFSISQIDELQELQRSLQQQSEYDAGKGGPGQRSSLSKQIKFARHASESNAGAGVSQDEDERTDFGIRTQNISKIVSCGGVRIRLPIGLRVQTDPANRRIAVAKSFKKALNLKRNSQRVQADAENNEHGFRFERRFTLSNDITIAREQIRRASELYAEWGRLSCSKFELSRVPASWFSYRVSLARTCTRRESEALSAQRATLDHLISRGPIAVYVLTLFLTRTPKAVHWDRVEEYAAR